MPKIGFRHSEETPKRMSEAHKGKPSPLKGRALTEEHKRKMSIAKQYRRIKTPGNRPNHA